MNDTITTVLVSSDTPVDQLFPTLTPAQIARFAARGRVRSFQRGEIVHSGEQVASFFVITAGQIEVVRSTCNGEEIVAIQGAGQFTGEMSLLSGRRGFVQLRGAESG
jgi:thioredoxin reductase (NADPH)